MRTAWVDRAIAGFLLLVGAAVVAIWAAALLGGAFAGGLLHYQDGNYPLLHLLAEGLMAAHALVAGLGLWQGRPWGRGLALLALGMLLYSSINSSGFALANEPPLVLPMVLTLIGAVPAALVLLGIRRGWEPPRSASRSGARR